MATIRTGLDTIKVLVNVTIGRKTISKPGRMTTRATMHGVIHIKMLGKQTPGMKELNQVIGTLMQAPVPDGMKEEAGSATMPHATSQLKEITQQRVLHIKTST